MSESVLDAWLHGEDDLFGDSGDIFNTDGSTVNRVASAGMAPHQLHLPDDGVSETHNNMRPIVDILHAPTLADVDAPVMCPPAFPASGDPALPQASADSSQLSGLSAGDDLALLQPTPAIDPLLAPYPDPATMALFSPFDETNAGPFYQPGALGMLPEAPGALASFHQPYLHTPTAFQLGLAELATGLKAATPPYKRRARIAHSRGKKRSITNNPTQFYTPLLQPPASWGYDPSKGVETFRYTDKGELEIGKKYTRAELEQFIRRRPARDGEHLILWVQNTPAQFNHRYPSRSESGVCRWADCPVKHNTILKGHWRVAFDERGDELGEMFDPFHNAGYVHLYCLETIFDLISLFLDPAVDIRPDMRRMGIEERNPMSLTRDHRELERAFVLWKEDQARKFQAWDNNLGDRKRKKDDYLYRRLTETHLRLESVGRAHCREARGGAHIALYMGDLNHYAELKGWHVEGKRRQSAHGGEAPHPLPPQRPARATRGRRGQHTDSSVPNRKESSASPSTGTKPEAAHSGAPRDQPAWPAAAQPTASRKRDWDEVGDDLEDARRSPRRPRLTAGGRRGPGMDIPSLQSILAHPGPVTRRQSHAMEAIMDRLSQAQVEEGSAASVLMGAIERMSMWKRRELHKFILRQNRKTRNIASF